MEQSLVKNQLERKNFLTPTWDNPMHKREQFSISLRKKNRDALVRNKRQKIQQSMEEQKQSIVKQMDLSDISEHDLSVMNEMKAKACPEDDDSFAQIESIIQFLTSTMDTIEYVKYASVLFKCLRLQSQDDQQFSRSLVLEVSNFTKFVKLNLMMFENGIQTDKIEDQNNTILITELTWLLVNISSFDCNQVCSKFVTSSDEIIKATSNLIDIVQFDAFYKIKGNQSIADNVLWFWSNLLAEEMEQEPSEDKTEQLLSERVCSKIAKDTCFLELVRLIIAGLKKDTSSQDKLHIQTIIWSMKNICLHKSFIIKSPLNIQKSLLLIVRQILFECFNLDTTENQFLYPLIQLLIDLLNISYKDDSSDFQIYMIENIDIKYILEKCLTSEGDDYKLMKLGVTLFGSLIQYEGNEGKLMKVTMPETMEYIDHNVFRDTSKMFDDEVSIESKKEIIEVHKVSLWMLSNFVVNQNVDGYNDKLIISKDLFGKVVQIAMSSRDVALNSESSKNTWSKYQNLFVESMYVIVTLMTRSDDESVFFQVVNDKAIIELLSYCLKEQFQLNLPEKLVYLALLALEIALNFSFFNNKEESLNIMDFDVKDYLVEITKNKALQEVLSHKLTEISEKAIQIEMDYFNDDDTDMLGDQNMLSHDNTNGGHLFDDTKFNI